MLVVDRSNSTIAKYFQSNSVKSTGKIAVAIVTNRGEHICHAAIVMRELCIHAVVGAEVAAEIIRNDGNVTFSYVEGDASKIFHGELRFDVEITDLCDLPRPATQIIIIL